MLRRLLERLGGGGERAAATPGEPAQQELYEGFELIARPVREGGVWRVAGSIRREGGSDGPSHDFVRADTMASHDEAVQMSLLKARQIVDEKGERLLPSA